MIYADTSFLFSFYALDENSPAAGRVYSVDARRPLFLSPWQRFELHNAVRLAVHRLHGAKLVVAFRPGNVFKQLEEDLEAGRLRHVDVDWRESLRLAEELSAAHTEATGVASVDVWHVAAAILLKADTFWTFDEAQQEMARRSRKFKSVPGLRP